MPTTNNANNKSLREAIDIITVADNSQIMITSRIKIVCQRLTNIAEETSNPEIEKEVKIIRALLNYLETNETDGRILDDTLWATSGLP